MAAVQGVDLTHRQKPIRDQFAEDVQRLRPQEGRLHRKAVLAIGRTDSGLATTARNPARMQTHCTNGSYSLGIPAHKLYLFARDSFLAVWIHILHLDLVRRKVVEHRDDPQRLALLVVKLLQTRYSLKHLWRCRHQLSSTRSANGHN